MSDPFYKGGRLVEKQKWQQQYDDHTFFYSMAPFQVSYNYEVIPHISRHCIVHLS